MLRTRKAKLITVFSIVCGLSLIAVLRYVASSPTFLSNRRLAALEAETFVEMQITNDLVPTEGNLGSRGPLPSGEYVIITQFFPVGRPPGDRMDVVGRFTI